CSRETPVSEFEQAPAPPVRLGELIRRYRELRGLGRQQLADRVGAHPAQVGRWEEKGNRPAGLTALELYRELRFEPPDDDLFMQLPGLPDEQVAPVRRSVSAHSGVAVLDGESTEPHLHEVDRHLESLRRLIYLGEHEYAAGEARRLVQLLRPAVQAEL